MPLILVGMIGLFPYQIQLLQLRQTLSSATGEERAAALERHAGLVPWQGGLWEQAGDARFLLEDWRAAGADYQRAERTGALSEAGSHRLAESMIQLDEVDAALAVYADLQTRGDEQAFWLAYRLQRQYGDLNGARSTLQAWVEILPDSGRAWYELGKFVLLEDPLTALEHLRRAARGRSEAHEAAERMIISLETALQQADGETDTAYFNLLAGRALASAGDWDLALDLFQQAVELDPQYADALAFLGQAQDMTGADGLPALKQALELNPASAVVQAMTGLHYSQTGDDVRAFDYLRRASLLEPTAAIWRMEMGRLQEQMGDLPSALAYYQQATRLEPADPLYWRELASFCVRTNTDLRGVGLPAARQALTLAPEDPANADMMGVVLLNLRDFSSAERFFSQALEHNPNYAPAHLHMGQLYLAWDRLDEAYEHLVMANQLAQTGSMEAEIARRLLTQYYGGGGLP